MTPPDWRERCDTSALARPDRPTRALLVANGSDAPFDGIAVLRADFRTREILPVTVADAGGTPVPSRIADETLGPVEADGKRRWSFALEFAARLPARTADAWAAWWGAQGPPLTGGADLPRLPAVERECVPGELPLPLALDPTQESQ